MNPLILVGLVGMAAYFLLEDKIKIGDGEEGERKQPPRKAASQSQGFFDINVNVKQDGAKARSKVVKPETDEKADE